MSSTQDARPGDVVRITRFAEQRIRDPMWGVVEDPPPDPTIRLFIITERKHRAWTFDVVALEDRLDTFEIVPPENIPDGVWVALASFRLDGGVRESW